uniref:Major facilitator superfamily (MFS) profile domain-containing protein n=1 Tax=Grammatophora oceanica TaxID=210454 RepID=A0A7S1UYJ8_9STRA|mmetsp:Transcript_29882/g.44131  ORF Transcript_29882/g.44131 Transcript_29882/m.44131 type:complete len:520 (+) Transcript_29882:208-1767(+)
MASINQESTPIEEGITHKLSHEVKEQASLRMEGPPTNERNRFNCCGWCRFNGVKMAQGYVFNNTARGPIVMSNVFLTASLVYLASEEAGCVDENDEILEDCDGKVFGWSPGPLIANIAVISGVLSAFFMPLFGAIMDYTQHRWSVGVAAAVLITLIQAVQSYTVSSTWFPMAILQAVAGLLYQIEVMSVYAYLPDISRVVGEAVVTKFHSTFTMVQFASQLIFAIVMTAIGFALSLDGVTSAQMAQGLNAVCITFSFVMSWRLLPRVPPSRELPEGRPLWIAGFIQVGQTAARIHRDFGQSLRWFFLALIFAEAAVNSFTTVSVIYLSEHVGLSAQEIGIFFLTTLVATLPGSVLGGFVTSRIQPKNSYRLCMLILVFVTIGGALILKSGAKAAAFIWGLCIGVMLGWYYPTENLFFSLCLPKGQDAEFAGFFVYCTQILGWLPPLVFALMVEADVDQKYGVMAITIFAVIAVGLISFLPSWDKVLKDAHRMDDTVYVPGPSGADLTTGDTPSELLSGE